MQNAPLTPEANRAARAILRWSVRDLADAAGIAFTTVHRFEQTGIATETTKAKIIAAYAARNVEITNGDGTGARLRKAPKEPEQPATGEGGIIDNNEM
jgi:transcriptional regulator with XRE-family HTH domain